MDPVRLEREISDVNIAALAGDGYPIIFLKSEWPDGTVYAHSAQGILTVDGQEWLGLDGIATPVVGSEGEGIAPSEASLNIQSTLGEILQHCNPDARNGLVELFLGSIDDLYNPELRGPMDLLWQGYIDSNEMSHQPATPGSPEASSLTVTVGTGPAARETAAVEHSGEQQRTRRAGDTLMDRLSAAAQWRRNPPQFPAP